MREKKVENKLPAQLLITHHFLRITVSLSGAKGLDGGCEALVACRGSVTT